METISLIGSTGSIGEQTLDVCRKHNIKIKALAAGSSVKRLAEQAHEFKPEYISKMDFYLEALDRQKIFRIESTYR